MIKYISQYYYQYSMQHMLTVYISLKMHVEQNTQNTNTQYNF